MAADICLFVLDIYLFVLDIYQLFITSIQGLCDVFIGSYQEVPAKSACVEAALRKILSQAELLLPKMEDVQAEMMGDLVEDEMHHTAKAIEEAAAKIAVRCFVVSCWFHFGKNFMVHYCRNV